MAKSKKPPEPKLGSVFGGAMDHENAKRGGAGYFTGGLERALLIAIPLRSFATRWLYGTDGYVLGRFNLAVGEPHHGKSALLFEHMKWHLEYDGGSQASYLLTEARDQAALRKSHIGYDPAILERCYAPIECPSIEAWQRPITAAIKALRENYETRRGPNHCMFMSVDSLTAVTSEKTIQSIEENGHASIGFAIDANLINTYTKYFPTRIVPWPLSMFCTNHVKFYVDPKAAFLGKQMKITGGDALRYHTTSIVVVTKGREIKYNTLVFPGGELRLAGGHHIRLKMNKNSVSGTGARQMDVEMIWWHEQVEDEQRQRTMWDWDGASIKILHLHQHQEAAKHPGLADIIEIPAMNVDEHRAKCPKLGFNRSAPLHEVGIALSQDATIMSQLSEFYGIARTTPFRPGVPWQQQREEAIAGGFVADEQAEDGEESPEVANGSATA